MPIGAARVPTGRWPAMNGTETGTRPCFGATYSGTFRAIDHEILKVDVRRRIGCERTLRLIDTIVDGSNPQEPVHHYYPGDDLFAPYERRRGLPIGNLTSQLFANVHLDGLDHFVKEVLRARGYVRYVDDFALFHDEPMVLAGWHERIEKYLARRRLSLHPVKTYVVPTAEPNVRRFRNRLRAMHDRLRTGTLTMREARQRIASWEAHARHANTRRLRRALFSGGTSDAAASLLSGRTAMSS